MYYTTNVIICGLNKDMSILVSSKSSTNLPCSLVILTNYKAVLHIKLTNQSQEFYPEPISGDPILSLDPLLLLLEH